MEVTVSIIRSVEQIKEIKKDWLRLSKIKRNPFLSFDWHLRWLEHFGSFEAWILIVRKADTVIAICPWGIKTNPFPFPHRTLSWIGYDEVTPTTLDILVDPKEWGIAKQALFETLSQENQYDRWDFPRVQNGTYAAELFLSLPFLSQGADTPSLVTDIPLDPKAYFEGLSRYLRKEIRKATKSLSALGELTLVICSSRESILDAFPTLVRLNQMRMLKKKIKGGFLNPSFATFHQALIPSLAEEGLAKLCLLKLDGQAIAVSFFLTSEDTLYGYQSGLDPAYEENSPLVVLSALLIEQLALDRSARYFDWGPGLDGYKLRFGGKKRRVKRFRGVQPTLRGNLWKSLFRIKRKMTSLPVQVSEAWNFEREDVVMAGELEKLKTEVHPGTEVIRLLLPSDLPAVERLLGKEKAIDFAQRLELGWAISAWEGENLLGYAWTTHHRRLTEGVAPFTYPVDPPYRTVYFYDFYVIPEMRNRGTGARIRSAQIKQAIFRGYQYVFLTHDCENAAVIGLSHKFGLLDAGRISYQRIGFRVRQDLRALERVGEEIRRGEGIRFLSPLTIETST